MAARNSASQAAITVPRALLDRSDPSLLDWHAAEVSR
jgi:hypothetical protein